MIIRYFYSDMLGGKPSDREKYTLLGDIPFRKAIIEFERELLLEEERRVIEMLDREDNIIDAEVLADEEQEKIYRQLLISFTKTS